MMRHPRKRNVVESGYPTLDDIEKASRTRLGHWVRYLKSPGEAGAGADNFADLLAFESAAMDLIMQRFKHLGGWSPRVSKAADKLHERKEAA